MACQEKKQNDITENLRELRAVGYVYVYVIWTSRGFDNAGQPIRGSLHDIQVFANGVDGAEYTAQYSKPNSGFWVDQQMAPVRVGVSFVSAGCVG